MNVPFHPSVERLLRAMQPREGGAVLTPELLRAFAKELGEQREHALIGAQLVALAKQFAEQRCPRTAEQLVMLAVRLQGDATTRAQLSGSGLDERSVKALMEQTELRPPHLGRGLDAPTGAGARLRRRR